MQSHSSRAYCGHVCARSTNSLVSVYTTYITTKRPQPICPTDDAGTSVTLGIRNQWLSSYQSYGRSIELFSTLKKDGHLTTS